MWTRALLVLGRKGARHEAVRRHPLGRAACAPPPAAQATLELIYGMPWFLTDARVNGGAR